ncbi:protein of unknown function [Ekhidna lutea]|uniref:SiaC family regulatory phosphoprotein domain-containing protein n=1 Tax=Ekhidna lutea TaxID=447679 RepID=A0A239IDL5_EKHLU|nr:DUF1987 domain-containing protein [Ekhidna lutea]SNS91661.1 protein of unknown function [Ekhidna lutea]
MKESYIREATRTTPYACVNFQAGKIELQGRSSPENTMEFYEPFIRAITMIGKLNKEKIEADFKLMYFNTSSARCIYLIVKQLKRLEDSGKNVVINWYAEEDDEDMLETGMDFQDIVDINFNIIMTKSTDEYV